MYKMRWLRKLLVCTVTREKNAQISTSTTKECPNLELIYISPTSNAVHLIPNASHENAKLVLEVGFGMLFFHVCMGVESHEHKIVKK